MHVHVCRLCASEKECPPVRARASAPSRPRSRVCVKGECARVIVCASRCARRGNEREREKEIEKSYKEEPIGSPARDRTTVGWLLDQNGRKDSMLASASVSSLRVHDDLQIDASLWEIERHLESFGTLQLYFETPPSSFLLSLFCLRSSTLRPLLSFSLSLSLSLSLALFLSLPSGELTPLRPPQASYFARRFCLSVSLEFSHCRCGDDVGRCVSGKLTGWSGHNDHFLGYILSTFNDPKL